MAKKKLTLTIEEDVIRDLKIYVLNQGSNNVSKLIEELATEFLKGEKEMKKYMIDTVEYEKDLETIKNSWTELETDNREEAVEEFERLKNVIRSGGVILSENLEGFYEWADEYNLDKKNNQNIFYKADGTEYTSDIKNDVYPSDDGEFVHVKAKRQDKDYILTFVANPEYNPDEQSQDEWSDWVVIAAEEI